MPVPAWLPEKVDTNGEWGDVLARLYRIFQIDFIGPGCYHQGSPVWWDTRNLDGEYQEGFWHLITRDNHAVGDRLFDPSRAECLPWCRPCLVNAPDVALKIWDYKESGNKMRTYVWLENNDYLIILERRSSRQGVIFFLITAYSVDGNDTRRKLQRKFEQRVVQNA
jgi:hypothetical protein